MAVVTTSDIPHFDRVLSDLAAFASIIYVGYSARTFRRQTRQMQADSAKAQAQSQHFEDVLKGVEAGPGIEARPSLVQRMAKLEDSHQTLVDKTDQQSVVLNKIFAQLQPDHGSSLADKVDALTDRMLDHLSLHAEPTPPPKPQQRRRPQPRTEKKDPQ